MLNLGGDWCVWGIQQKQSGLVRGGIWSIRRSRLRGFNEINGRHEETRTPDLYRVNFEVIPLKPFSSLALPVFLRIKIPVKHPSFGDELVTSFTFLLGAM